ETASDTVGGDERQARLPPVRAGALRSGRGAGQPIMPSPVRQQLGQPLSCVVVGDAAVTLRCAEMLRERGHRLLGMVTADARVAARCASPVAPVPCHFAPPESGL